jgi:poly-gamma-glutamate synthesis protein (capsule biosynthesis protein)
VANNHVLDFGVVGMHETLETLHAASIGHAGAGKDLAQAQRPHIHTLPDGRRILVFGWGFADSHIAFAHWAADENRPGIALLADCGEDAARRITDCIAGWRQPGDIVIASLHWGANWVPQIPAAHKAFARVLIDRAGVDVIHGHSSHHVLPAELYKGKPILYGCGDLINDSEGKPENRARRGYLGALYFVDLHAETRQLTALRVQPVQRRRFRLELPSQEDSRWVLQQVRGSRAE